MKPQEIKLKLAKKDFISKSQYTIDQRKRLEYYFYSIVAGVARKMEGKILNVKFEKEIQAALPEKFYIRKVTHEEFALCRRNDENYYEMAYLPFRLSLENGRIMGASFDGNKTLKWLAKFDETTKEIEESIKNYDSYISKAKKLLKAIEEFNKLPYNFRHNIDNSLYIYK